MKLFKFIVLSVLLAPISIYAEDTILLDPYWEKVSSIEYADSYMVTRPDSSIVPGGRVELVYYLSGRPKSVNHQINISKSSKKENYVNEGRFQTWYENGQLRREINYHHNAYEGELHTYWKNGSAKRHDVYSAGKLIMGKCFASDGSEIPYYPLEIPAEYDGGPTEMMNFINKNLRYPEDAREDGVSGIQEVTFTVNIDGSINDIRTKKIRHLSLMKEVSRVVSIMPTWKPATFDGVPYKSSYSLPVNFRMN